jgi:hypothetical protein
MTDEHLQRTAVLEIEVKTVKETLARIEPMVTETHQRVTQWGGVVTGIAIAVSALWAGVIGLWSVVKHKFG